ncbi:MAG: tetratricopeptide repeat protein [Acidobacteria bacterium]|nr:tetratricopeptide repeat protein [Acidobacteriota bacterium]
MRRSGVVFLIALFIGHGAPAINASAKDTWTSVKTKHFVLVGNAGDKEIRKVAGKLEQFRDVFSKLFARANLNSPVPIRVIVFKNRHSYLPFMPIYQGKVSEVAGYFQSGQDVHYITLTSELSQENPYSTIFHEYIHALTNDNTFQSPPWFSEGLAEFYSSFEITDGDKKVWVGKPISHHVHLLREHKFLPLPKLFAVHRDSPDYNERDKQGVFYAQSWALVHYLLLGNNGQRKPQFIKYLELLSQAKSVDESFKEAFQTDYSTIEKELKNYINRDKYPVQIFSSSSGQKLEFNITMESTQISEAEWNYYLGDLVLHLNRTDCETYLKKAIKLDPNLAVAHASLGMAQMKSQRFSEAKGSLQQALATGTENHMVHYYYAFILSREGMDAKNIITGYQPETAVTMRKHLKRAIEISPGFPESYNLLAFINMVLGEELDESAKLLRQAIALSPSRQEFSFMLAQILMRQQKYEDARTIVEPLARNASEAQIRANAQTLLERLNQITERLAEFNAARQESVTPRSEDERERTKPRLIVRSSAFDGEKLHGLLIEIICSVEGMTLVIKDGDLIAKLHTNMPENLRFIADHHDPGSLINCGKIDPAKPVIATYRKSTDADSPYKGEPIALEFKKPDKK